MTLGSNALNLKIPVLELFIVTLFLQEKNQLLSKLIATDKDITKCLDRLVQEGKVISLNGKFLLNYTHKGIVKITETKFRRDRYSGKKLFDYCSGLYGKFKDKLYPIFPVKAMPIVKDFLDEFPGTEAEVLDAIQFYYEDLVEKETYKERIVLSYAKSLVKLLEDKDTLNSLLAKEVIYSPYTEL